jgi:hypothetical protein
MKIIVTATFVREIEVENLEGATLEAAFLKTQDDAWKRFDEDVVFRDEADDTWIEMRIA